MRTIDKIISKVNTQNGAPMGRANIGSIPENYTGQLFDCAVPMSADSVYDKGGTYWGLGPQLRVKYNKELSIVIFYRKGSEPHTTVRYKII